jgi:hypothetical protein
MGLINESPAMPIPVLPCPVSTRILNGKMVVQINSISGGSTMDNNDSSKPQNIFENKKEPKSKNKSNKVNLFDLAAAESVESKLQVVRLGSDETAIIPFTAESYTVELHYCSETEINSYVHCNGPDCVLCRIGRKLNQRQLLPVYLPTEGCVGILLVSGSFRPFALLPQILNVLKAEKRMVMFVARDGAKYTVSTAELHKDVDDGKSEIKRFLEDYEAGLHDLSTVYPTIENDQLASVGEIGQMIMLKGIRWDGGDKRS